MMKKIFVFGVFLVLIGSVALVWRASLFPGKPSENRTPEESATDGEKEAGLAAVQCEEGTSDFDCYKTHYVRLVKERGMEEAFKDLKARYAVDPYVTAQCHQLTHVLGYEASKGKTDIAEAYRGGDSFCWSGFYHGVVEGFAGRTNLNEFLKNINDACRPLAETGRYSFNHYNCVHGLGHGVMALLDGELPESLAACDQLADAWEQSSCFSGAFMENVMLDNRYHKAKYLKPEDPFYPCNAIADKYRSTCWLMQTSYMLSISGSDFAEVFEQCSRVEEGYRNICYQSLGRDASGQSVSDVARTKETCYLGSTREARENCAIGAVKDFISYLHDDARAREFCAALPEESVRATCLSTAESYYRAF